MQLNGLVLLVLHKVWRAGHFWFFRAGRLGGVICKPEGVKTPPRLRARKNQECTMDRLYFISKMPKNVDNLNLKFLTVRILELYSACYGGCPLLDTSNIRIACHGRRVLELLCVSAFIAIPYAEANENAVVCRQGAMRWRLRSLYPLRMHFSKGRRQNSGPFIQI